MIHVSGVGFYAPIKSTTFITGTILDSLSRFAVPVFIMISGALMLDETKKLSNKRILKKSLFLFFILCIWSFVNAVYFQIIIPIKDGEKISKLQFLKECILGHYHLWYLYMLIGLYLITPILRYFVKKSNVKLVIYFILLSVLFQFITPSFNLILNKVFPSSLDNIYSDYVDGFILDFICGYTTYYLLGWLITNFNLKKSYKIVVYVCGLLGLLIIIIGTFLIVRNDYRTEIFFSNLNLPVLLYSASLFLFIYDFFKNKKLGEKSSKILAKLSVLTFGIYLSHVICLHIVDNVFLSINFGFIGIKYIIVWATTTVFSFLISYIISKIPYVKNIIKA